MTKSTRALRSLPIVVLLFAAASLAGQSLSFSARQYLGLGLPLAVAAGDFNGDGIQDLVTVGCDGTSASNIYLLLGNGDGTFKPAKAINVGKAVCDTTPGGGGGQSIAVGDVNRDGKLDIVVAVAHFGLPLGEVVLLTGRGDGTFNTPVFVIPERLQADYVALADVNGDGILDLVGAVGSSRSSGGVIICLGNGDGSFNLFEDQNVAGVQSQIAIADFNGDHLPDIAVNSPDGVVSVLLRKPTAAFPMYQPAIHTTAGETVGDSNFAVGDFNQDGLADIAVPAQGPDRVIILLGKGDGTFQRSDIAMPPLDYSAIGEIAVADFDSDGKLDLIVDSNGSKFVLLGKGDGTFQPLVGVGAGQTLFVRQIIIADFNGDGRPDFATADSYFGGTSSTGSITVWLNTSVAGPPVITSPPATLQATVGVPFRYQIIATNNPTSYSVGGLPPGVIYDATTGLISGTPAVAQIAVLRITASNSAGTSATVIVNMTILAAGAPVDPPVITSALTVQATEGVPFRYQITATNSPTSYSVGGLPPGLTYDATTGLISGTPTEAQIAVLRITASNSAGTSETVIVNMRIVAAGAPVMTSALTVQATVGTPFLYQIAATNNPTSYRSGSGLPPGLGLNTTTGLISGTPTMVLTAVVAITASNSAGTSAAVNLSIVVSPGVSTVSVVNAASNQATLAPGALATVYGANFAAPAAIVFNNDAAGLPANNAGCGFGLIGGHNNVCGFSFTAPSTSDFVFARGEVALYQPEWTMDVTLALYADSGGVPGTLLESISLSDVQTGLAAIAFNSAVYPILTAGHQYWLVASVPDGSVASGTWLRPATADPGLEALSVDGGLWDVTSNLRGAFQIHGFPRAGSVPLPLTLGGASLKVGGRPAPILYAGSGQINFQVPYEATTGTSTVAVTAGGVSSPAAPVTVAAAAPGIFVYGNNWAIVQNRDYSLNGPSNPEKVGNYITLYGTGGGAVTPAVATGNAAPASTVSVTTLDVTASINGVPASVIFAGLTPGAVGLLQVNIQVPDLPSGIYPIQIREGGVNSNAPSVAIVQ